MNFRNVMIGAGALVGIAALVVLIKIVYFPSAESHVSRKAVAASQVAMLHTAAAEPARPLLSASKEPKALPPQDVDILSEVEFFPASLPEGDVILPRKDDIADALPVPVSELESLTHWNSPDEDVRLAMAEGGVNFESDGVRVMPVKTPLVAPTNGTRVLSPTLPARQAAGTAQTRHEAVQDQPAGCPEGYRPSQRDFGTEPFEPVKENGKIFDGWAKPHATLVFTGQLNGYMEPCGCAGMDRMKGGLSRRATLLDGLRRGGWAPVVMDTGGISVGFSQQARMKFQTTVNMFREMDYDAITLGTSDLNFPAGDILSEVATPAKNGNMFVGANVGIFAMDVRTLPPAKIIQRDGVKIGVVGILGESQRQQVRNDEIAFLTSDEALKTIIPSLRGKCDFLVLLAHATEDESRAFAKDFPQIDIIATSAGPAVPPAVMEILPETGQYYITVGEKGTHLIVLGIYRDENIPVRYQRVPLDSRFAPSKKFVDLMALYQDQLEHTGLKGLGIRPLPSPFAQTHGGYVGSARCESCHEDVFIQWQKTRHAKAWKPLADATPARTSDPECVVCHVVGWNVEHKTPYESGFLDPRQTPHLMNVGCEACHGPGENHIAAEMGKDEALQLRYRKASQQTVEDAKKSLCVSCHDLDNSPNFDFDLYWKCIQHKENYDE